MLQKEIDRYGDVLQNCALFAGVKKEELTCLLLENGEVQSYGAGQVIFAPDNFKDAVGIFLTGAAKAEKISDSRTLELNRFTPPMMFGAAAVFTRTDEYVTRVSALAPCKILFITAGQLSEIFRASPKISENYIGFLSGRIAFLNRKIDSFTQNSAEEKMALFLHDACKNQAEPFMVPCSPTRFASELGISRATVYRALGHFEKLGYIQKKGKNLYIHNPTALLYYKENERK